MQAMDPLIGDRLRHAEDDPKGIWVVALRRYTRMNSSLPAIVGKGLLR